MTQPRTDQAPAAPEEAADSVLAGRYRLQHRLGAGAMGVVWLADDERLQRPVAVKQLWPSTPDPAQDRETRARALREGRIAARLRHPHVVTVHDVTEHNGQPMLVMEYVPSRSLATVLAEQGALSPRTVARLGIQAASALAAAHAAGIVHRDVKPGNILVGDDGTIKIADFGISQAPGDVTISRSGVVAGTPAYLAPEIARGHQPSPESDIFSLGSTLYTAVEGVPAFGEDGEEPLAVLRRVAATDFEPPRQAGPLRPVLMAMMRPEPEARPTAGQLTVALSAVAEGRPLDPATLDPASGRTQPVLRTPAESSATGPVPEFQTAGGGTRLDSRPVSAETAPGSG
ncbi:serine/threonine-protein kinase, partial [Amycolatopsis rhizosphaerae]